MGKASRRKSTRSQDENARSQWCYYCGRPTDCRPTDCPSKQTYEDREVRPVPGDEDGPGGSRWPHSSVRQKVPPLCEAWKQGYAATQTVRSRW